MVELSQTLKINNILCNTIVKRSHIQRFEMKHIKEKKYNNSIKNSVFSFYQSDHKSKYCVRKKYR